MLTLLVLKICGATCTEEASPSIVHVDQERITHTVIEFLTDSCGRHEDQLYLSEYVSHKLQQRIFNIELDVEAKNTIVVEA